MMMLLLLVSQALWANEQIVNKFAVVSDSISLDSPAYRQHVQEQASELVNLWKKGVVENVYLNREPNEPGPESKRKVSIVFFIKAKNEKKANEILNQLPFVKHDVVDYTLYPVGFLWLKQVEDGTE